MAKKRSLGYRLAFADEGAHHDNLREHLAGQGDRHQCSATDASQALE
jgi:hypothetical protein